MAKMLTGDIHFGKTSALPLAVLNTMIGVLGICKSKDITELIILGDLLDNQTIVSHRILADEIGVFLDTARTMGIKVTILHGNHDGRDMEERKTSNLRQLNLFGARLVDSIQQEGSILWVPWVYKGEKLRVNKNDVVLGHLPINGFSMTGTMVESNGMDAPSHDALTYLGHFHAFQQVGNITYVGSPLQHSFADTNTDKFVHIVDDDFKLLESIITNDLFPNYITLDMGALDVDLEVTKGSKVRMLNVDPIDIEVVEKGMLEAGARTVEIHTVDKEFEELDDVVYASLTVEDAISEIINARESDAQPELLEVHEFMLKKSKADEKARIV